MLSSTWGAGEFTCKLRRRPHGESLAIIRRPTGAPGAYRDSRRNPRSHPSWPGPPRRPVRSNRGRGIRTQLTFHSFHLYSFAPHTSARGTSDPCLDWSVLRTPLLHARIPGAHGQNT